MIDIYYDERNINIMEHLDTLKKLLEAAKNGDEDGFIPDLTDSEIQAIEWAISTIENCQAYIDETSVETMEKKLEPYYEEVSKLYSG
jgi:hypothetical protein